MWKVILVCVVMAAASTEAAIRNRKRNAGYASAGGYAGSSAGSYAGDDYGTGGFVGTGFGYAPEFGPGFIDPFTFHQQLTAQILSQHAAQNNALASTFSSGDASVNAEASFYPDEDEEYNRQQQAQQQAYFDAIRRQNHYNNKGYKPNRYAPSFASASGSVGPGGFYQSASINPENPGSPNIVNRFGASSGGPNGFKGVSVSSFSSSSDVNGKRTSHRGAQTTVNDNGKVTTYRVNS